MTGRWCARWRGVNRGAPPLLGAAAQWPRGACVLGSGMTAHRWLGLRTGAWKQRRREANVLIGAAVALAHALGAELTRLSTRAATLEDVFVTLTGRHLRDG